jgi:hypothetical protein
MSYLINYNKATLTSKLLYDKPTGTIYNQETLVGDAANKLADLFREIPGESLPTSLNCKPIYDASGSSSFIIRANYYFPIVGCLLIVKLVFTVKNTDSLSYNAGTTSPTPTIVVQVWNKVIPRGFLINGITGGTNKIMEYGPASFSLNYCNGEFNPQVSSYGLNYNIPIVIAPGFTQIFCNLPVVFVPVALSNNGGSNPYILQCVNNETVSLNNGNIDVNTLTIGTEIGDQTPYTSQPYGYFVVNFAFPTNYSSYTNTVNLYANNTLKNIWRSPLSIYSSSRIFSEIDMVNKQVVLLFGQTKGGATFLVVNSGTPIEMITSFATTSLNNFMSIMNAIIQYYNISYTITDYFINPSLITTLNQVYNLSISPVNLQSLITGSISTPNSTDRSYYFLLNASNSAKFTVDFSGQNVFNQDIGENYFGLTNSTLTSIGNCTYGNKNLNSLSTLSVPSGIFGNSIYLGLNQIQNTRYYVFMVLPETLFNINNVSSYTISIYPTLNSIFYITSDNTSTQYNLTYPINKYVLTVSQTPIAL